LNFRDVKLDDVSHVYSGRPGCGCGCKGKYFYAYPGAAADSSDVEVTNPKMVKRVFNKFQKAGKELKYQDGIFSIETDKRYYWLYLKEGK